jgi:hypothetical protein
MVVALAADALGRKVVGRAHDALLGRGALGRRLGADEAGDAEIHHLDHAAAPAAGGQHDVVGLDVEMDDALVVGGARALHTWRRMGITRSGPRLLSTSSTRRKDGPSMYSMT